MGTAKIVNVGVDTLMLNTFYIDERGKPFKGELASSLRVQLDEWKRAVQETHEECPTTLTFNGAVVHMFPNGAGSRAMALDAQNQGHHSLRVWWSLEWHRIIALQFAVPLDVSGCA